MDGSVCLQMNLVLIAPKYTSQGSLEESIGQHFHESYTGCPEKETNPPIKDHTAF